MAKDIRMTNCSFGQKKRSCLTLYQNKSCINKNILQDIIPVIKHSLDFRRRKAFLKLKLENKPLQL